MTFEAKCEQAQICILVANEPRSYREVIAAAFRTLRPEHNVVMIEPQDLQEAIDRMNPDLVICNEIRGVLGARPLTWIALYPAGESQVTVVLDGVAITACDLDLQRMLGIIDETARRLAQAS